MEILVHAESSMIAIIVMKYAVSLVVVYILTLFLPTHCQQNSPFYQTPVSHVVNGVTIMAPVMTGPAVMGSSLLATDEDNKTIQDLEMGVQYKEKSKPSRKHKSKRHKSKSKSRSRSSPADGADDSPRASKGSERSKEKQARRKRWNGSLGSEDLDKKHHKKQHLAVP